MNQEEDILVTILDLKLQCEDLVYVIYRCIGNYNILVKGTITITGAGNDDDVKRADERGKGVTFKN